jgi:site-specific recombinase XerD
MAERLQDLHRSFARHLRAEGASDRTVFIYGQAVRFFSEWLEAQGREPVLDELNRAAIREWLSQLADTHEPSTVKTRYRGLFRFCGWLVDEEELDAHPMKTLSLPQPKAKPVPVLSDQELAALLKACAGKEFADLRDEAMVGLLLDCGIRVSELCGLTVDGLDLDHGMALVRGKGRSQPSPITP